MSAAVTVDRDVVAVLVAALLVGAASSGGVGSLASAAWSVRGQLGDVGHVGRPGWSDAVGSGTFVYLSAEAPRRSRPGPATL